MGYSMKSYQSMLSVFILFVLFGFTSCKKGEDPVSIKTPPQVSTGSASWIRPAEATLSGTVNANNANTTVSFEYGLDSASLGLTVNAIPNMVSGITDTTVSADITGLSSNAKYYYRIKAQNEIGTTYGSRLTFRTLNNVYFNPDVTYGTVNDYDGNVYKTVQIGTQTWMAENLRTETYNQGTAIPFVTDRTKWAALATSGYCWYNSSSDFYGALYNWHAVDTGLLCPVGWHVPTDTEWTILTDYLGGETLAGIKLKEPETLHWSSLNSNTTNESGFTALPGGYRNYQGIFANIRQMGYWWSSTKDGSSYAVYRALAGNYSNVDKNISFIKSGFSVRCLKDN